MTNYHSRDVAKHINYAIVLFIQNDFELFQVDIRFNNDRNLTYSISYTPKLEGQHKVSVLYAGREIPKSPYSVLVEGHAGDANKVTASGPGLEPEGVVVGRPTYFDIFTKGNLIKEKKNSKSKEEK